MENEKLCLLLIPVLIMTLSCGSRPQTVPPPETPSRIIEAKDEPAAENKEFDPGNVSDEYYALTRAAVSSFIEDLNMIIYNKNYDAWKAALSPDFFETISTPEHLHHVSLSAAMINRHIVLRSPEDYFHYVVVPSRAHSHLEDIEFISLLRVKAFTTVQTKNGHIQRLRLYDLELFGNMWKIIN